MQITIFDIETNAIDDFITLEGLEKIHCIALICTYNVLVASLLAYHSP